MIIVIRELQAHIGVAHLMILCRFALLVTVGHQHGAYVVHIVEGAVVIEVRIECDGLVIGRTRDILSTRFLVHRTIVVQTYDNILAVVVSPCRLEGGVGIVERC